MFHIPIINFCFLLILAITSFLFFSFSPHQILPLPEVKSEKKRELPTPPFKLEEKAYEAIGEGPLKLKWSPPTMELPDLRHELLYYGKNGKPSRRDGKDLISIALKEGGVCKSFEPGQKIYLICKESLAFSPKNRPTALWLEAHLQGHDNLNIFVTMRDDQSHEIITPEASHHFTLTTTEFKAPPYTGWELGAGLRADTTLLIRQHARWLGRDLFLETHGGDAFAKIKTKQRIDFIDSQSPYCCYVAEGDVLIYSDGKWQEGDADTEGYPLLFVKKIDEKIISFELWDSEGKGRFALNLVHTKIHEPLPDLLQEFKFVGARSFSQLIFECKSKRMTLRPGDWLVLTPEGWHKLASAEEVDDYVERRLQGPLFVLEKVAKKEGHQVLAGHLFNTTRNEMQQIDLPIIEAKGKI